MEPTVDYTRDVRPILAEHCFSCHGRDKKARKGRLRLDQRDAAIKKEAIVPGDVEESELVYRIFTDDPDEIMPPPKHKKKLTLKQKELLKKWVQEGAPYQSHWAFIPPKKTTLPSVESQAWVKNPIDRFILSKLEKLGLSPAGEAPPRVLFRRLHLDVTGLPPNPEDTDAFEEAFKKNAEKTLSQWIDKLMSRSTWGEHRARYWLDAARYADTHGLHFDNYREMWPYRDWVIRAFNKNQPFDEFTLEQIAGDLFEKPTLDQLVATGFQRCNITTNEGGTIDEENLANYAVDRVQTFGWVFMGLTTNCAQCHDHKFDPFSMKDFYSLAAYFRNTTQGPKDGNAKDGRGPVISVPHSSDYDRFNALPELIEAAKKERASYKESVRPAFTSWAKTLKAETITQKAPTEGLLLHVPMNEGDGSEVKSLKGKVKKSKVKGSVSWIPGPKASKAPQIQSSRTFNFGDAGNFEKDQAFSYGAWVWPASRRTNAAILARMDEGKAFRGWDLWQNNREFGVHIIDAWPNNSFKVITQTNSVKSKKWQHVFVTYDGSGGPGGVKIYVDGKVQKLRVENNSIKPNASIKTKTPFRIGQRSQSAVFNGGGIQDVRIYSKLLGPAEIQAISQSSAFKEILSTPPEKRNPDQIRVLFDHYLGAVDKKYADFEKKVSTLETELSSIRSRGAITHIQKEKPNSKPMAHMLIRGEYDRKGELLVAATPSALYPMPEDVPNNRLGLAKWLLAAENPLLTRVTVNRFWQEIFGLGLVATPEDFGVMGSPPSHPELLDWLAVDLRERDWDVKKFFKQILMSATYRQSAATTDIKLEKDRDNVFLSRGPRFRMDAEMVRDHALKASGLLSKTMYGPGVKPYQPIGIWDVVGLPGGNTRNYVQSQGEDLHRRTLYTFWKRMAPPPGLEALNAPSREVCTVRRERTNTPLQALVTLNDPQYVEAARVLAQAALLHGKKDPKKTLDFIGQRILSRNFIPIEKEILFSDLNEFLKYYNLNGDDAKILTSIGVTKRDESVDVIALAAWTIVCNQVMNLDEALNK